MGIMLEIPLLRNVLIGAGTLVAIGFLLMRRLAVIDV
jgi:hypothetical protein